MSAGYGSGVMAPGTGIWHNNCIGELELNRRGFDVGPPGTRLPSNMAPTVARRRDGTVLAIGSPGADRITTALVQSLFNHLHLGMDLQEAVDHPRAHVEFTASGPPLACEPVLPLELVTMPTRVFPERSMFFGGVAAAQWDPLHGFAAGADPRRAGSHATGSGASIPRSDAEA
jgi:gamma-glutamyltranspeptidase/glutathione hydrolase